MLQINNRPRNELGRQIEVNIPKHKGVSLLRWVRIRENEIVAVLPDFYIQTSMLL